MPGVCRCTRLHRCVLARRDVCIFVAVSGVERGDRRGDRVAMAWLMSPQFASGRHARGSLALICQGLQ
jgi:hypothetical protein